MTVPTREPTIALLMWGDLFEDFFDTIGVSVEDFRTTLSGMWLFGYADALRAVGVRTVLIYVSARVSTTQRFVHVPTGTPVVILPAPGRLRFARAIARHVPLRRAARSVASWLALPIARFARELRRQGADAILVQEYEYARFDLCVVLGRLMRLPVYATFQGGDHPTSRLERLVRPVTVRASSGLIVAAATERARAIHTYRLPPGRVADIPNPVDVHAYRPMERGRARAVLGVDADAVVVEWHGRVTIRRKGLDVLLASWDEVCRRRPDMNLLLLLVGSGQDAPELRRRLRAFPFDTIRWTDEFLTDRTTLLTYLSAADLFVFPSRHEGFPVAPIEAMAAHLPVVAAAAPGVPDIFEGGEESGGIVVPAADPAALAAALGSLIDDPGRRVRLGGYARRRAEERFSLESVGPRLRTFLLGRARAHRERL